ncbi:MAG TPA: hypothetical protein VK821_06880 [Dehalococcoidia bacterium]|nr:hypothetical protein [Dehalococcoidia bacterium]
MSSAESGLPNAPSVVDAVLARLPLADRERASARHRQIRERLGAFALVTLLLLACIGPQASNVATRTFAWLLAAAETWRVLVSILLGGLVLVPVLSAICLLAVSFVLWQRVIGFEQRGAR